MSNEYSYPYFNPRKRAERYADDLKGYSLEDRPVEKYGKFKGDVMSENGFSYRQGYLNRGKDEAYQYKANRLYWAGMPVGKDGDNINKYAATRTNRQVTAHINREKNTMTWKENAEARKAQRALRRADYYRDQLGSQEE